MRVLLVTEEREVIVALRDLLSFEHMDVRHAPDVEAAIELVASLRPDAILVDGSPRGIRERELVRALKSVAASPPVVVLADAPRTGAVGLEGAIVLPRPADSDQLIRALREAAARGVSAPGTSPVCEASAAG